MLLMLEKGISSKICHAILQSTKNDNKVHERL